MNELDQETNPIIGRQLGNDDWKDRFGKFFLTSTVRPTSLLFVKAWTNSRKNPNAIEQEEGWERRMSLIR